MCVSQLARAVLQLTDPFCVLNQWVPSYPASTLPWLRLKSKWAWAAKTELSSQLTIPGLKNDRFGKPWVFQITGVKMRLGRQNRKIAPTDNF